MNKKLKVIVCGTTFGQYYLAALKLLKEEFEIVGLLANGSERSKLCAEKYNIPLFTSTSGLPADVNLACVVIRSGAIGGSGTEIALELLEHKINVIQEQPIHPRDLESCYRAARKNKVHFMTGDLYPNMTEVRRFINCACELNKLDSPVYINASFCPQVSYPAMDILMRALPSIRTWEIEALNQNIGPFDILTAKLGGIPVTIEYNNQINPHDPDNYMHLLHNLVIVYESGRLTLEDTFGPVIWKPRMHIPTSLYNPNSEQNITPAHLLENSIEILGDYRERSFDTVITKEWPIAIARDLLSVRDLILDGANANRKAQQEVLCSKQWSEMTKIFGYARFLSENKTRHHHISFDSIRSFADNI